MLNEMYRENAEKFEKDFNVLKQEHSEAKEPSKVKL